MTLQGLQSYCSINKTILIDHVPVGVGRIFETGVLR